MIHIYISQQVVQIAPPKAKKTKLQESGTGLLVQRERKEAENTKM